MARTPIVNNRDLRFPFKVVWVQGYESDSSPVYASLTENSRSPRHISPTYVLLGAEVE